jgi:hypothetical protein
MLIQAGLSHLSRPFRNRLSLSFSVPGFSVPSFFREYLDGSTIQGEEKLSGQK